MFAYVGIEIRDLCGRINKVKNETIVNIIVIRNLKLYIKLLNMLILL